MTELVSSVTVDPNDSAPCPFNKKGVCTQFCVNHNRSLSLKATDKLLVKLFGQVAVDQAEQQRLLELEKSGEIDRAACKPVYPMRN